MPVLVDFVFNSVWQINYFAYTAPIAMENQSADKPFFVSDNAVPGSCLSFISQYNCLVIKLLQEHNKPLWERKFQHSAYFVIR